MDEFATGFLAGQGNDGNRDDGMGGGFMMIFLLVILAMSGGGGGLFGGNRNDGGNCATKSDLCDGFNFNNLEQSVRGVQNGLCDGFYAQNTTMLQGFNGIGNGLANIGHQIDQCCCTTQRSIDGVNYNMAKGFCDVIQSAHADTDRIIGYLTADKIQSLQTELQSAQLQLSNAAQTRAIVDQIRPCPIPAFPSCNPWAYNNSGCGCGV